jgi:hypothetical protein
VMMKAANDERPSAEVGGYQILGENRILVVTCNFQEQPCLWPVACHTVSGGCVVVC